ncbi:hypothetical protein K7X08_014989 [Anisodus acutangulus]|uniref:Uncharacterized protein n=1 Tax=Anisodus acutangulus TaxID=402998 RepID=A0A9Q1L5V8_9SOLA|nr:hypothetical protein K7X08_014989 [Anisodus acutangulus]
MTSGNTTPRSLTVNAGTHTPTSRIGTTQGFGTVATATNEIMSSTVVAVEPNIHEEEQPAGEPKAQRTIDLGKETVKVKGPPGNYFDQLVIYDWKPSYCYVFLDLEHMCQPKQDKAPKQDNAPKHGPKEMKNTKD